MRLRAARAEDLFDLPLHLLEVHELPVDRGEPDVGDLVEVAQPVHHHLADLAARNLDATGAPELGLDVVHDRAQPLWRDVALLGRFLQACEKLLRIEILSPPILLRDEERDGLDSFVRSESLPALQALTPATDRLTDLRVARVDHLQVVMTAVRAAHVCPCYIRLRRNAGILMSPSSSAPNSGRSIVRRIVSCLASTWVLPPKPVAMTVTLISPCMLSSRTTPKMMLALGSAAARTISAAFCTSCRVMSLPAVMLKRIPLAPSIDVSTRGLETACLAASSARVSPAPCPMPMRASPSFSMIAFTSANSRLMTPGLVTRSEMPCTPWRRTSSAMRKASSRVVFELATWASRSFGMTMSASTWLRSDLMPSSAVSLRTRPSNANGRVTTPMVSAPDSLASSATMAAEPVPVPPPIPAVMNTMSESWTTAESSVLLSSAASRPRVQSPPAPRPRVILLPIWTLTSAWQRSRACLSVLTAMNSTLSAFEIMRLTAFPPPPPQPTTLIRARPSCNKLSFITSS